MNDYQSLTLGECFNFRAGTVFPLDKQGRGNGEYPFIKVSDMNRSDNARRILGANNWIEKIDLEQLRAQPFPAGTTVFAKIGEALKQNRVRFLTQPTVIDNNMMGAMPTPTLLDNRFAYYMLSQVDFAELANGTALPYLTVEGLSSEEVVVPPLPEQRAIADILGTLDDKIELNRWMNETLEAIARALFKSWFVDFDPVYAKVGRRETGLRKSLEDLFPSRVVASGIGEIPEGWSVRELGQAAEAPRRGVSPADIQSNTPYIGLEHMPRGSVALGEWGDSGSVTSNKSIFEKGEFLFGKLRPYFHKVGIAPVEGVCSTDVVVVRPKKREWSSFVLACISSGDFVKYTDVTSTGTKMPRTSWKTMSAYPVCVPPAEIAEAFENTVRPALDRIVANIHESRALAAMRDALLPRLISGETRIENHGHTVHGGSG